MLALLFIASIMVTGCGPTNPVESQLVTASKYFPNVITFSKEFVDSHGKISHVTTVELKVLITEPEEFVHELVLNAFTNFTKEERQEKVDKLDSHFSVPMYEGAITDSLTDEFNAWLLAAAVAAYDAQGQVQALDNRIPWDIYDTNMPYKVLGSAKSTTKKSTIITYDFAEAEVSISESYKDAPTGPIIDN